MRSIKLTVAVVAAATALTLASAAASARGTHEHRGSHHGGGCRVTLNVAPRLITSGESALAFGRLSCHSEAEDANQTVTLYESSATAPGYGIAGTTTTDATGFYQVTVTALTTNSSFYVTAGAAQSGHRSVKVAAQVTLSGPPEGVVPTALRTGHHNQVTFTGKVSPADAGAVVVLQRQNAVRGNEWHRIGHDVQVSKGGEFTITHTFVYAGDANIRVVVRGGDRNAPSPSNVLGYEIVPGPEPAADDRKLGQPDLLRAVDHDQGRRRGCGEHTGAAARAHRPAGELHRPRGSQDRRRRHIHVRAADAAR